MKKTIVLLILMAVATVSAMALDQKTLDGNRYIAQKEREIREARSQGNTAQVTRLVELRDSAIINHHINRYLYGPCPTDMSEIEDSKVYIRRIETPSFKDFVSSYEPLLTLYPGFTNALYGIAANSTFDSALNSGKLLRATEAAELRAALENCNYWRYYLTRRDPATVVSIPYLDDIVDRLLALIDNMELYLDGSNVAQYRAERNAILEALKAGGSTLDPNVVYVGDVKFEMVKVEGGTFQMGATKEQKGADSDEKPVHQVVLSTFMIGKTEVTQELWEAVMGSNPSHFKGANLPVEWVSWDDCQEFIAKLNNMTGYNFRLPTEAEWEYAARGGNKSKGYQYSGSDDLGAVAWYDDNSYSTHPVATKAPNELGIYDMSGNVWEWCRDRYGSYSKDPVSNPMGASSGSDRVYRGGGWFDGAVRSRVASRSSNLPVYRNDRLGLRLAL